MNNKTRRLKRLLEDPKNLAKIAEQMLSPLKKDLLYEGRVRQLFRMYGKCCTWCNEPWSKHDDKQIEHPFFHNNLEYLEWEEKRRSDEKIKASSDGDGRSVLERNQDSDPPV